MRYRICKLENEETYTIQKKYPLIPIWFFIYDIPGYHEDKITTYQTLEAAKERLEFLNQKPLEKKWVEIKIK